MSWNITILQKWKELSPICHSWPFYYYQGQNTRLLYLHWFLWQGTLSAIIKTLKVYVHSSLESSYPQNLTVQSGQDGPNGIFLYCTSGIGWNELFPRGTTSSGEEWDWVESPVDQGGERQPSCSDFSIWRCPLNQPQPDPHLAQLICICPAQSVFQRVW